MAALVALLMMPVWSLLVEPSGYLRHVGKSLLRGEPCSPAHQVIQQHRPVMPAASATGRSYTL